MEKDHCTCGQDLSPTEEPVATRRSVLGWLVTGINLAVVSALAVPALRFVAAPLSRRSTEKWVDVLSESDLVHGSTREVSYTIKVVDGYQTIDRKYTVYLHKGDDGVKCFDPACTHLGCRIKFQEDQRRYFCPCHGGVFDEMGKVVSGPPPKGLVEHPVKVQKGRILVSRNV